MNAPVSLRDVRRFMDDYLRIGQIADFPNALNGLQLENGGAVTRVAAAVDGCGYTVAKAIDCGADLLLVHHGLFWSGLQTLTGGVYKLWKNAIEGGLAVYSAHLPLDVHPEVGNNALLCRALGLNTTVPFLDFKGLSIGLRATIGMGREELAARLRQAVNGEVKICPGGPEHVREIGVVTGGAGTEVRAVAAQGIDTFITGEGSHWTYALTEELGVNILYGGHYATETFGVKALAAELQRRFGLPWEFIDHPTGL